MKKTTATCLSIILLSATIFSAISMDYSTQAAPIPEPTITNIPHNQIYINGNADFATQAANEGWAGDGSAGDPYVIEGYDIQTNTSDAIRIESTDVHFIIRNVNIRYGSNNHEYNGTYLSNVNNGIIENCNIEWMICGIYLYNSEGNNISRNRITNSSENQVKLINSNSNTIYQNTLRY